MEGDLEPPPQATRKTSGRTTSARNFIVEHSTCRVPQPFAFFAKAGVVHSSQNGTLNELYCAGVPWGLKRYQQTRQLHFITFSCYHRAPLLTPDARTSSFENWREFASGTDSGLWATS